MSTLEVKYDPLRPAGHLPRKRGRKLRLVMHFLPPFMGEVAAKPTKGVVGIGRMF